jgi:eukaryotic-like serine/threonine-protein kinase
LLVTGARFGAFEIVERLGAGGMGEVYRARDTRLDRTVALKIVRPSHTRQREWIDRFMREARAISRVNHPHICSLYDIGEHDGEAFLVMEYISGETLADRILRGSMDLDEAIKYGVQIADALAAAHRAGVVHCDLKPSNIMLTREGVKLLDFGLARLRETDPDVETIANTTTDLGLSADGRLVGSLPYMSPEQVEGKRADARSDLFALGAVLYEMVIGEQPFRATSKAGLLVAILHDQPAAPIVRRPSVPPLLDRAITRCLAKAPDKRWQSAADLSAELTYILESPAVAPARRTVTHRAGYLAAIAAGLAVIAAAAFGFMAMTGDARSTPTYQRITYRRGVITSARMTPDHNTILYSASWEGRPYDLYLTTLGSAESRPLGLADARLLSISAANELAFSRGRQSVYRAFGMLAHVPLTGGTPRELLANVAAADWMPTGSELAVLRSSPDGSGRMQVEFPIGHKVYESPTLTSLRVSPNGDRVAFLDGNQSRSVVVADRSGQTRVLSRGWWALGVAWSPRGDEVWFSGSTPSTDSRGLKPALWAVSLTGKERRIADAPDELRIQDVLPDGRVLAVRDYGREGFACHTPDESGERDLSWFNGSSLEVLSADGRTVVFGETRLATSIYLRKTDGSPAVRLGNGYPEDLSPDGQLVLARSRTVPATWSLIPVGPGEPRPLPPGNLTGRFEANFLPNGEGVVFGGAEPGHDRRIYVQDLKGGLPQAISPDGVRTFAVTTPDSRFVIGSMKGRHLLFPVDGGAPRPLPFLSPEDSPLQWTSDGRSLYVVRASPWADTTAEIYQTMQAHIDKVDTVTGTRVPWKTITPADPVGLEAVNEVFINPEGTAYCYGYLRTLSDLYVIDGVK